MSAAAPAGRKLGRLALLGFVVASAGGPLALFALYLVPTAGVGRSQLLPATLLGIAVFLAPLAIWRGYARTVASDGGQYAFVERAWGRRAARVQGWLWTLAYLLYLPYTVTYIVSYLLPDLWTLAPWQSDLLTLALPVGICLVVAFGTRAAIGALGVVAALQLAALAVIAGVVLGHPPAAPGTALLALPGPAGLTALAGGGAGIAFLFVCMGLVVFLGGEAREGGAAIRWSLGAGYAIVAPFTLLAAAALAIGLPAALAKGSAPGIALARLDASRAGADAIGLIVMAATAALIVAEFIAIPRLWRAMFQLPDRTSLVLISAFFVAADAGSLINPWRFYTLAITPSLIALFLSQAIVFAAYPSLGAARGRDRAVAWCLAAVACLGALYGLYGAVTGAGLFGA